MRFITSTALMITLSACHQGVNKTSDAASKTQTATAPTEHQQDVKSQHKNFIQVRNGQLYDGDERFRFISFNVPTLLYVEDEMAFDQQNPYGLPTEFELRDLYETVNQLGGNLIRAYTIPVRNTNFPPESVTYVEAPGIFNENAFKAMDLAIALAGEYNVRLVIPLLNDQQWMGGRPNYAEFRNKPNEVFYTDRELIDDFKKTITHVLTRVNTITGIPYAEDPTIMAWETGNELENPDAWLTEIAAHIKSLAPKQLLIDGYNAIHYNDAPGVIGKSQFPREASLNDPNVDLVNTHHYEPSAPDTIKNLKETVRRVGGRKPIFLGEFGFISTPGAEDVMEYITSEPSIPGGLMWSLRRHHKNGGFYHHTEPFGRGLYRAYQWPGFADGNGYDETKLLNTARAHAHMIRGITPPAITAPKPPKIIPFQATPLFSWQGSAGASGYDIERASTKSGPWTQITYNKDDMETPGFALYTDENAPLDTPVCYRIIARNAGGMSNPSTPYCIDKLDYLTRVDNARNLSYLNTFEGIEVAYGDNRSYKEAFSRLKGETGAVLTYAAPSEETLALRIFAYDDDKSPNIKLSVSSDGETFQSVTPTLSIYASDEKNYAYKVPIQYELSTEQLSNVKLIKLNFTGTSDIVRTEIEYK